MSSGPARRSWWRRNAVALVALVPALAATVLVGIVVPWRAYVDDHRSPTHVAAGHDAHLGDATFRMLKAGRFHPDGHPGVDVPKGTEILAVLVRITTPRKLTATCDVSLQDIRDPKISWDPLPDPEQYRYQESDSTAHLCDLSAASGSQTLELTFLVPDDAYARSAIDVQSGTRGSDPHQYEVLLDLPGTPVSDRSG